jgi:large subunit ribosomal protein L13e
VRTWFDQPGRKLRRRNARKTKAASLGVRPLSLLRPAVRAQTVRYNRKVREGRGFTLAELKEAGIGRKEAGGVGIVVDHRRRNLSEEGKKVNVERLKTYKARLIVFPRKAGKPKKGDSSVGFSFSVEIKGTDMV